MLELNLVFAKMKKRLTIFFFVIHAINKNRRRMAQKGEHHTLEIFFIVFTHNVFSDLFSQEPEVKNVSGPLSSTLFSVMYEKS